MAQSPKEKGKVWRRLFIAVLIVAIAGSLAGNVYQYLHPRVLRAQVITLDSTATIPSIEAYLDSISPSYVASVQALAKEYNLPSWGCGPSSYALALILNKKFFHNQFPINATYNPNETYQIVERFSFVQTPTDKGDYVVTDHAWIEIYLGKQFLFVDPTIGQFGKYTTIVYSQFDVGDQNLSAELGTKYDILDVRFARLMQKMIDRVPVDQEPYPGASIDPKSMSYYDQVLDDRNMINAGQEPADWKVWVAALTGEFK